MAILNGLTVDELTIVSVDADPIFNGAAAPIGSLAMMDGTDGLWSKVGPLDTDWEVVKQDRSKYYYCEDDFDGPISTLSGRLGWGNTVSGGTLTQPAGNVGVNPTDRAIGVWQLSTGTSATGRVTMHMSTIMQQYLFGYAQFQQEWRIKVPTLFTTAQAAELTLGFIDNAAGSVGHTDGVYFKYTQATANWQGVCSNNLTRSEVDLGVAVTTGWTTLKMVVNNTGTSVRWYINGILVNTQTSANIPKVALRETGCGAKLIKTAGTTAVTTLLDRFIQRIDWPTARIP